MCWGCDNTSISYQSSNNSQLKIINQFTKMRSFIILIVVICVAMAMAEPPKRRFNLRTIARQEVEDNGNAPDEEPQEPQGYNYEPPAAEAQRLKLPTKFRFNAFARQQEQPSNGGYQYPKPDDSYGAPEGDTTEEPSTEYGPPATEDNSEETTDVPETTANPQAESLKGIEASQLRRKTAKFSSAQKLINAKLIQQQQQLQPIIYVQQYPFASDLVEPQYVYIFK